MTVAPLCFPQVALTREPRRSAVHDHQLRMQAPATDPINTVSNRDWIPSCSLVVHLVVIVASANGQLGAVACSCIESSGHVPRTVADGVDKTVTGVPDASSSSPVRVETDKSEYTCTSPTQMSNESSGRTSVDLSQHFECGLTSCPPPPLFRHEQ